MKQVGIIGAGASGLVAAIFAAREGASVTVFETNLKPGKKLLMTGNGKCNLTNLSMTSECFYSEDSVFVRQILDAFNASETTAFFESLGVVLTEKNGYVYPYSGQAVTVLEALCAEANRLQVQFVFGTKILQICPVNRKWKVTGLQEEQPFSSDLFDTCIIACGSCAAPKTGSDGALMSVINRLSISTRDFVPALCGLHLEGKKWKAISGVRANAKVYLETSEGNLAESDGEIQFTDYGISGIVVFQISRIASFALANGNTVSGRIDFYPEYEDAEFEMVWQKRLAFIRRSAETGADAQSAFSGMLHSKLMSAILLEAGIHNSDAIASISEQKINRVKKLMRAFPFQVIGTNDFSQSQTAAGGVLISEIDTNLEAKTQKGLFFTGEILDVDGICGGYNLQWAWSTGFVAGKNAGGSSDVGNLAN